MLADEDAWVVRALLEVKYGRINQIWDESMLFDEVVVDKDEDQVSDDEPLDESIDWSNFVQPVNIYGKKDNYKIVEFFFDTNQPLPRRGKPLPWQKYLRKFINELKQMDVIEQDATVYVMVTSIDKSHRGNVFYVAEHPTGTYEKFQYYGAIEHVSRFIKAGMVRKVRENKQDWIYGRPAAKHPTYEEFLAQTDQNTPQ